MTEGFRAAMAALVVRTYSPMNARRKGMNFSAALRAAREKLPNADVAASGDSATHRDTQNQSLPIRYFYLRTLFRMCSNDTSAAS